MKTIIQIIIVIFSTISIIMLIVGVLRYITSGGDTSKVGTAKTTIIYSVFLLLLVSFIFIPSYFFIPNLLVLPGLKSFLQDIIIVLSFIAIGMVVIGALRYSTSGGDPGSISAAKNSILYSLIILFFLTFASLLVFFFLPPVSFDVLSLASFINGFFLLGMVGLTIVAQLITVASRRREVADKNKKKEFDVFLCYSRENSSAVRKLAQELQEHGILPWFDEEQVPPGQTWQTALAQQHSQIKAVIVCFGEDVIAPWQQQDIEAFLREFVAREQPVIPVLLQGASAEPKLPFFLTGRAWIDLSKSSPSAYDQLSRGITGRRWENFFTGEQKKEASTGDSKRVSQPSTQETEVQAAVKVVRLALYNVAYQELQQLSLAILKLLGVTDFQLIEISDTEHASVLQIQLPLSSLGFTFNAGKALFLLRRREPSEVFYKELSHIKCEIEADIIMMVDLLENMTSPSLLDSTVVWIRPEHLEELVSTQREEVVSWLGRLVASQIKNLEYLLRYRTEGPTDSKLFYGREVELSQLLSTTVQGGVLLGAHQSGKTSLLKQLQKRLQEQDRYVSAECSIGNWSLRTFFENTLDKLSLPIPDDLTPESWASILRSHHMKGKTPVLLLDEVDELIEEDIKAGFPLGREMRALQNDNCCKFYLAGHGELRKAIEIEQGPFRNFAYETILKGLDEKAGRQLIQEPIRAIGFSISDEQASRIYLGAAGVAVLIQRFCRELMLSIHAGRKVPYVSDAAIGEIEEDPGYLSFVLRYYRYKQTSDSIAVMLMIAERQMKREDIFRTFSLYRDAITWDDLDAVLQFLLTFGTLKQLRGGYFCLSSGYLRRAIEIHYNPDIWLPELLKEGKEQ